jgi:centractin
MMNSSTVFCFKLLIFSSCLVE